MMDEVTVLWWRYSDGSAAGIERVYAGHAEANADQQMLSDAGSSKIYYTERMPVIPSRAKAPAA